jgi:hypothetical protein
MSKSINPANLHAVQLTTSAGNPIADNQNSLSATVLLILLVCADG